MSYKIGAYKQLGLLHELIAGVNADAPAAADIDRVHASLRAAVEDARSGPRDLSSRLQSDDAKTYASGIDRGPQAHGGAMGRVMNAARFAACVGGVPRLSPMHPDGCAVRSTARPMWSFAVRR